MIGDLPEIPARALPARALALIREVLANHPSVRAAILFGSRAKGTARAGADVDLALVGDLPIAEVARIAAELDARDFPFELDLVRLDALEEPDVREHIARAGLVIYELK